MSLSAENDTPDTFGHMADLDFRVAAFNTAYCRPSGPLSERDAVYWDAVP